MRTEFTKSDKVGDAIMFAARATDSDDPRRIMNGVRIEKREDGYRVIGTDGARLHYADVDAFDGLLDPGFYKAIIRGRIVNLVPIADAPDFPSYEKVIPAMNVLEKIGHTCADAKTIKAKKLLGPGNCAAFHIFNKGIFMNVDFINDAVKSDDMDIYCHIDGPELKPVVFHNHTKHAVVMPVRQAS